MKKLSSTFSLLVLTVFIIPSVAFASWWNPFTWSFFVKKNPPVQQEVIPSEKIEVTDKKVVATSSPKQQPNKALPTSVTPVKPVVSKFDKYAVSTTSTITNKEAPEITEYRNQIVLMYTDEITRFKNAQSIKGIIKTGVENSVSEIEDKITQGEGFKIGNPNATDGVNYIATLFKAQLDFKAKELDNWTYAIKWLEVSQTDLKNTLSQLSTLTTKDQLDKTVQNIKFYEDNFDKLEKNLSDWSDADHKLQIRTDAIIAGLGSLSSTNTSNLPTVTPVYQPTFTPSVSPYKLNCTSSKNFLGEVQTQCY